jgi:16S rRNA (cytosine967-C5)-methyltransferase
VLTIAAAADGPRLANRFARGNRGDRAAVRDHVFDAIRRRRSLAALGGAETGGA